MSCLAKVNAQVYMSLILCNAVHMALLNGVKSYSDDTVIMAVDLLHSSKRSIPPSNSFLLVAYIFFASSSYSLSFLVLSSPLPLLLSSFLFSPCLYLHSNLISLAASHSRFPLSPPLPSPPSQFRVSRRPAG